MQLKQCWPAWQRVAWAEQQQLAALGVPQQAAKAAAAAAEQQQVQVQVVLIAVAAAQ